jgi:hypothetical protein
MSYSSRVALPGRACVPATLRMPSRAAPTLRACSVPKEPIPSCFATLEKKICSATLREQKDPDRSKSYSATLGKVNMSGHTLRVPAAGAATYGTRLGLALRAHAALNSWYSFTCNSRAGARCVQAGGVQKQQAPELAVRLCMYLQQAPELAVLLRHVWELDGPYGGPDLGQALRDDCDSVAGLVAGVDDDGLHTPTIRHVEKTIHPPRRGRRRRRPGLGWIHPGVEIVGGSGPRLRGNGEKIRDYALQPHAAVEIYSQK